MKPSASVLNILDFAILRLEFEFIPDLNNVNFKQTFDEYDLNIDFGLRISENIQVFMKGEINADKKLPGYSIFIEVGCVFKLDENINITNEAKDSIQGYSTIYMALNVMRTYISQITANGPLGKYTLPSIDLNDLIEQKRRNVNENIDDTVPQKKKKTAIKKKTV